MLEDILLYNLSQQSIAITNIVQEIKRATQNGREYYLVTNFS